MSKVIPEGLGVFVWLPAKCGSWDVIIAKAKEHGVKWLIVHNAQGPYALIKSAGLQAAYSGYLYPTATDKYIQQAKKAVDAGADIVLFDAETEWEQGGYKGLQASTFETTLRQTLGDSVWIGNAGAWQWPEKHPVYPDTAFARGIDGALPERYWTEFDYKTPYSAAIGESEKEWERYKDVHGYKSVIPIGSAYGTNTSPPGGHQDLREEDLRDFLTRFPTCALWSWLHIPPFGWDVIRSIHEASSSGNPCGKGE